jgi:hypothetical protein
MFFKGRTMEDKLLLWPLLFEGDMKVDRVFYRWGYGYGYGYGYGDGNGYGYG